MFVVWLVLALITSATVLAIAYWSLLTALYPERLRTKEVYTVVTADLWKLRLCRYRKGRAPGEPVFLVHGSEANHHNFTSPAGACLIDYLVERGYDCWAIDLRGCRSSTAPFGRNALEVTMDDYLLLDLPAALEFIARNTGYAKVHWIGHSLGGMLLYAYAQKFGTGQIASGTTLGSPIGFDGVNKQVPADLAGLLGPIRGLAGACLRGTIPLFMLLGTGGPMFPINLRNRPRKLGMGHFFNMIEDPLPKVLHELGFCLNRKIWRMDRDQLDVKAGLSSMAFPLLAIYGNRDPFTPLDHARAFVDRLPTEDKQMLVCSKETGCKFDYNHCDLAFGAEGAKEVFEPIARWIASHPSGEHIVTEPGDEGEIITRPLRGHEREGILSGGSYAHVHAEPEAREVATKTAKRPGTEATADTPATREPRAKAVKPSPPAAESIPEPVSKPLPEIVPVLDQPVATVSLPQEAPAPAIDAIPVDLEVTAASALAELEKKLSRTLAATPKPTRSDRIGRAASSLKSVAGNLGEDPPVTPMVETPEAPKKKATAKRTPVKQAAAKKTPAKTKAVKTTPVKATPAKPAATTGKPAAKKSAAKPKSVAKPKAAAKPKATAAPKASPKPKPPAKAKPSAKPAGKAPAKKKAAAKPTAKKK